MSKVALVYLCSAESREFCAARNGGLLTSPEAQQASHFPNNNFWMPDAAAPARRTRTRMGGRFRSDPAPTARNQASLEPLSFFKGTGVADRYPQRNARYRAVAGRICTADPQPPDRSSIRTAQQGNRRADLCRMGRLFPFAQIATHGEGRPRLRRPGLRACDRLDQGPRRHRRSATPPRRPVRRQTGLVDQRLIAERTYLPGRDVEKLSALQGCRTCPHRTWPCGRSA